MPRLAASMAVLLTVAVSIGFNTARYPVVWEMVAEGHYPEQSVESTEASSASPSLAFAEPTPCDEVGSSVAEEPLPVTAFVATPPVEMAQETAPAESIDVVSTDVAPTAVPDAQPLEPLVVPSSVVDPVVEMTPMAVMAMTDVDSLEEDELAASSGVLPMAAAEPAGKYAASVDVESPEMAPMTGLSMLAEPTGWPAGQEVDEGTASVRPLPPLDRVWTAPEASDETPIPAGRIPIYPSTDSRGA